MTETKNALHLVLLTLETYYNQTFTIDNLALNDSLKLVVIGGFDSAAAALDYMVKAKAQAPGNIIPWLPPAKYTFLIISPDNLELLMRNKDLLAYRKFLAAAFPGKF